jgi:hypothetical protein
LEKFAWEKRSSLSSVCVSDEGKKDFDTDKNISSFLNKEFCCCDVVLLWSLSTIQAKRRRRRKYFC